MIEFNKINKSFKTKKILNDISFNIIKGQCVAFIGKSGKGKTTILNIIGLLDSYDSGEYILDGISVTSMSRKDKRKVFLNKIGYLFQNYALIDDETVLNNLLISIVAKQTKKNKIKRIKEVLAMVNLSGFETMKVYQLSGGEQQRVAIARLLLKDCDIILADEPTGSLDTESRNSILELLNILRKQNKTIVIVTHDMFVANWCDIRYKL